MLLLLNRPRQKKYPLQLNRTAQLIPTASAQMAFLAYDMFCDSGKDGNMKCHFYSEKEHFQNKAAFQEKKGFGLSPEF